MNNSTDLNYALIYLHEHYPDAQINNNKYVIANTQTEMQDVFRFASMKQSVFRNITYSDSLFENVAFTGSSFESVKFNKTKLIGNSFANCDFYNTEINGVRAALTANNFSQSNFELCSFNNVKFFRSGVLNALFHRCIFNHVQLRGSTFEGTKFINCSFTNCDFGNVNIDYALFSKNTCNGITFPFYQIAYIIGAADFLSNNTHGVYAKAGEKIISSSEYFEQSEKLIAYYLDKGEFFPACNLSIAQKNYEKAKEYLCSGIDKALENKNFRMISNYCRLAKYHGIADERTKRKILHLMEDVIQSDHISESQLNYYLIYIGNIKTLLNEGSGESVTLNYTIRTNTCKKNEEDVQHINDMVSRLNIALSALESTQGYEVTITNHSPFEIAIAVITLMASLPSAVESVMNIITDIKNKKTLLKKEKGAYYVRVDVETEKKYVDERIDRLKAELLLLNKQYSERELDEHIVEITQSLKTDLEELYSKDVMLYRLRKKRD